VNASLTRIISLLVRGVAPTAAVASGLLPAPVLSAPGDLDSTFGDFGRVGPIMDFSGPAWSAALLGNDTTLIAGGDFGCHDYFCYYYSRPVASNFLSELSTTGLPEPGFVPAQVKNTQVLDVALLPGGGIIAVGQTTVRQGIFTVIRKLTVFQLTAGGALDTGFGSAGIFQLPAATMGEYKATSVVLDPDGRIVVAGPTTASGNPGKVFVLRLLANGVLDTTFGDGGVYSGPPSDFVDSAIHILRTGAGGYRVTTSDCKIVALTADGKLDLMFGTAGIAPPPSGNPVTCNSMAAQADGSLLVAGSAGPEQSFAGRLLANGTADPSFSPIAVETGMADATALAVGADGSIVVAGTRPGGLSGDVVMRLQANGMLDLVFGRGGSTIVDLPSELGTYPVIHELLLRPDSAVVAAGGDFRSNHPFVVRLVGLGGADSPGVLGVTTASTVSVQEQSQEAIVKVQRTGGAAGSVSVAYQTVPIPQSATANQDYTPVSGRLSWSAGDASEQEIHVPIVADNVIEVQEYFTVVLSDPQGGAGLATRDATVEIQPDGSPYGQFQIGVNTPSVTEPGTAELFVSRNYYGSGAVSVTVTPKAGTATAGSDFAPAPVTVSWADGETGAKTVTVAIPDDAVQEPDETFTVELSNPTGGAIIGPESTVTVTIAASDQPPPPSPAPSSGGGGGGSIGFGSLLLLGVARLLKRRRVSARPHPPVN
jgi:uncharacterized delta-60 repeat protein